MASGAIQQVLDSLTEWLKGGEMPEMVEQEPFGVDVPLLRPQPVEFTPPPPFDPAPILNQAITNDHGAISDWRAQIKGAKERALRMEAALAGTVELEWVTSERNQEVRRALLEIYGFEKFMQDVGAEVVAKDVYGELIQWEQRGEVVRNHDFSATGIVNLGPSTFTHTLILDRVRAVRVLNSSPEPDGTYRTYILRVPAWIERPRQGIAWTFGLEESEYDPEKMT